MKTSLKILAVSPFLGVGALIAAIFSALLSAILATGFAGTILLAIAWEDLKRIYREKISRKMFCILS